MVEREPAGEVVCPGCGDATDADADFCGRCGAPRGRFTTLDPLKAIDAQGWLFRKSARARIRPFVLVGMWALLGIPVAGLVLSAVGRPAITRTSSFWVSAIVSALYLLVLVRVTGNFVRNRPGPGPWDPDRR
ncbi:MAG: hypothetical protein ACREAA_09685 [Candidatus Polarisedimenticolia bacterium]